MGASNADSSGRSTPTVAPDSCERCCTPSPDDPRGLHPVSTDLTSSRHADFDGGDVSPEEIQETDCRGHDVSGPRSSTRHPVSDKPRRPLQTISSTRSPSSASSVSTPANGSAAAYRSAQAKLSGAMEMKRRERFLVFVRIMFKCLDESESVDQELRSKAKQVVKDCTKKNREHVPGYESLVDSCQIKLRAVVGEVHWHRAEQYLQHYTIARRRRAVAEAASRAAMERRSTQRRQKTVALAG